MDFKLLKELCAIQGATGDEVSVRDFLIDLISEQEPEAQLFFGSGFQDNLLVVKGKPSTAVYSHMDSTGYMVRYDNKVIPIGGAEAKSGDVLVGKDIDGDIETAILIDGNTYYLAYPRPIEAGTRLTYKPNFIETDAHISSPYLDNRLGIFMALQVLRLSENVAIAFTCGEEHGGGNAGFCAKYLFENYSISQSLILDITWETDGVFQGSGTVISLRDVSIPRKAYLDRIRTIAKTSNIPFQLEVEEYGGSDGKEIHALPHPIDWCFIGPPEQGAHSSLETATKADIEATIAMYKHLIERL